MSLRTAIEEQYRIKTGYAEPEHAVDQASSLNTLSRDLYTDAKRFVYELLQNADDASDGTAVKVAVRLFRNNLVIAHTGKVFNERDLRGLCGVNDGTKKKAVEKTGYKGIGFKAVFGQSQKVTIFSSSEYFRFDATYDFEWKSEWGESKEAWEHDRDRKFEYPWQIIPIYTNTDDVPQDVSEFLGNGDWNVATIIELKNIIETTQAIKELSQNLNMFLFLKNIHELDFNLGEPLLIQLNRNDEKKEIIVKLNGEIKATWILNTILLEVPEDVKIKLRQDENIPDKLKTVDQTELLFAAKKTDQGLINLNSNEKLIYSYLPTEEQRYSFPVLVNAGFLTAANREALHTDSPWNEWLFKKIGLEIFKWIGELVKSELQYQAYRILPKQATTDDGLARAFNDGFNEALANVRFIISQNDNLLMKNESIIDSTFLSDQTFIGKDTISNFLSSKHEDKSLDENSFIPDTGFANELKQLGVVSFEWSNTEELFETEGFRNNHSIESNKQLIHHIKTLCEADQPKEVTLETIGKWAFIYDHKDQLKIAEQVFFPATDDTTWNDPENELSFLAQEIQDWLLHEPDTRAWLQSLGIVEKSDLSYLQKKVIPNAKSYATHENSVKTIQTIFLQYSKNELTDELSQLGELKLITKNNSLLAANEGFLANFYNPRLELENVLEEDIYISENYFIEGTEVDEWKRFFKQMGVKDGVEITTFPNKTSVDELKEIGFDPDYFGLEDKKFYSGAFSADKYSQFISLTNIHKTGGYDFSIKFWSDVIDKKIPANLIEKTTIFWGYPGYSGRSSGNKAKNYIEWFIKNKNCIPTTQKVCLPTKDVFINEESIQAVAGQYLPVFDGEALSSKWKSFFQFKTQLELTDYLEVLRQISLDPNSKNQIKNESRKQVDLIFKYLLDSFTNWGEEEQQVIKDWAAINSLADLNGDFQACATLKYYIDGNSNIFQGAYSFIYLGTSNRNHLKVENLLQLLNVEIFSQSHFEVKLENKQPATTFISKLKNVLPFWAKWMEREVQGGFEQQKIELETKLEQLQIFQANSLSITYGESFEKPVSSHLSGSFLFILNKWESATVMLDLPDKLITYFNAKGYRKELEFLLKADTDEIIEHFNREGIELPPKDESVNDIQKRENDQGDQEHVFHETTIDYSALRQKNAERNEVLFEGFSGSTKEHIIYGLQRQSSEYNDSIYHFTHIENAVKIIRAKSIKSRKAASFKNSAGSGIIAQTNESTKEFARFYFRPHTPTQYYIENWGRGKDSIKKLGDEPICPIPVFFKIPLQNALDSTDWNISLGNMAVPSMVHGNDLETIKQFDFNGAYKSIEEIERNRFMAASHQEFLVKDEMIIEDFPYELIVQNKSAKKSLLALLDDPEKWDNRIHINPKFYYNENPQINIYEDSNQLSIDYGTSRAGKMILQIEGNGNWHCVSGDESLTQYHFKNESTISATNSIVLEGDLSQIKYAFYYYYKGREWLIHTNRPDADFKTTYLSEVVNHWFTEKESEEELLNILCIHPELNHWYNQKVGGPDNLTLYQHTLDVMKNYTKFFKGKQKVFDEEKLFLLHLALHDIGKPMAISNGNKNDQHEYSIELIDRIKDILGRESEVIETIKTILNGDPLGKYLNPKVSQSKEVTIDQVKQMATNLGADVKEFWTDLVIYYQCDAAGYESLRKNIFSISTEGDLEFDVTLNRLKFKTEIEEKFKFLENEIAL